MYKMRLIFFLVFFLFGASAIDEPDYFARNTNVGVVEEQFYLHNPRSLHSQFRGHPIAVLYSCAVEIGSAPSDTCDLLTKMANAEKAIKFHDIETHSEFAINFFVTKRGLDEASFVDAFPDCGLTSSETIMIASGIGMNDLKACFYKFSLWYLGFEIEVLREREVDYGLFRSIILHYTEY